MFDTTLRDTADLVRRSDDAFRLVDLQVVAGRSGMSTATGRILGPDGRDQAQVGLGIAPVHATYREIVQAPNGLEEFKIHSVTERIDAQNAVSVRSSSQSVPERIGSDGPDSDILAASAHAYINARHRLIGRRPRCPFGRSRKARAGKTRKKGQSERSAV